MSTPDIMYETIRRFTVHSLETVFLDSGTIELVEIKYPAYEEIVVKTTQAPTGNCQLMSISNFEKFIELTDKVYRSEINVGKGEKIHMRVFGQRMLRLFLCGDRYLKPIICANIPVNCMGRAGQYFDIRNTFVCSFPPEEVTNFILIKSR